MNAATKTETLIERLLKRAKEDRQCAENSAVVADALSGQMERFESRDEQRPWNTYAVRMAVDHRNSVKRDTQYADDLIEAVAIISKATS